MNIKREDSISCGSDCETFPMSQQNYSIKESDNEHYLEPMNIKNEDSISYNSESDSIPPELRGDEMNFDDIMKFEAASRTIKKEFDASKFDNNLFSMQSIKTQPCEENHQTNQPKWTMNENIVNTKEETYSMIGRSCRAQKFIPNPNDNATDSSGSNYSNEANNIDSDSSSTLDITINLTNNRKDLNCSFCKKTFRSTRDRMDHENSHTGKRPHKCHICSRSFTATSSLHKHLQSHPGAIVKKTINRSNSPKVLDCCFCGKMLKCIRDREEHENTHTGKRPHQCRICPKTFTSSSSLRRHDRVHKDDRRHECQVCKKRFIIKSKLDKHIRENHLPDTDPRRYFPCKLCDTKLESYSQLDLHRRREHRSLIFTCDCCQKQYKKKESIVEHMKIHSGQKRNKYKCNYCHMTFMREYSKTKHQLECKNSSE